MDSKKQQCTNNKMLIFFTLSFLISTIIVLTIAFNGPSQFGKKTVFFMATFIFLVPAYLGLLTIKFMEQQRRCIACFYVEFFQVYYPVVLLCFLVWSMIEDWKQGFVLTIGLGLVMLCQALAMDQVMDVVVGDDDDDDLSVLSAELP